MSEITEEMIEAGDNVLGEYWALPCAARIGAVRRIYTAMRAVSPDQTNGLLREALVAERLLASIWFYGSFKAETHNERLLQEHMERVGLWPIKNEADLFAKIDTALASTPTARTEESELPDALSPLIGRLASWEAGLAERHPGWAAPDSKRIEVRCGDIRRLRAAAPEIKCALALLWSLKQDEGNWFAVRCDGPLNWAKTAPRSQEAILFACETDEHAIIERMANALAPLCDDNWERAFVVARDVLAEALRSRLMKGE